MMKLNRGSFWGALFITTSGFREGRHTRFFQAQCVNGGNHRNYCRTFHRSDLTLITRYEGVPIIGQFTYLNYDLFEVEITSPVTRLKDGYYDRHFCSSSENDIHQRR